MEGSKISYRDRIRLFRKDARLYIVSNAIGSFSFGVSWVILNLYLIESGFGEDFLGLLELRKRAEIVADKSFADEEKLDVT